MLRTANQHDNLTKIEEFEGFFSANNLCSDLIQCNQSVKCFTQVKIQLFLYINISFIFQTVTIFHSGVKYPNLTPNVYQTGHTIVFSQPW